MKCLILGGAGFLGSHLCEGLLGAGHAVRVFDLANVDTTNIAHLMDRIEIVGGDFADASGHAALMTGVDCVFHLISTTVPATSNVNPYFDLDSNVLASVAFLDTALKSGVKKIIYFSSGGAVYGLPQVLPIGEEHPTDPVNSYGIHKLAVEKYLQLYHHLYGLDYTILRISNPYGTRQRADGVQGVVAAFARRAANNEPVEIWGDGTAVRDYIHVTDVVAAALAALDYSPGERVFNIGGGEGRSLIDVVRAIESAMNWRLEIEFKSPSAGQVPVNVLDITRARQELDWAPRIRFVDGIRKTVGRSWYRPGLQLILRHGTGAGYFKRSEVRAPGQ